MSNEKATAKTAVIPERLYNGIIKENPTFVLALGMCPTLAVTTSTINGLGMGLTTCVVLALSNVMISLLRNIIPNRVRIPAFIVIIASFVTMVQLLLEAYIPFLNDALGVYIPLIVVNCIILGRAESYAYSHGPVGSLFDGIGMGLGFSVALTLIGGFRELLGAGTLFDVQVMPSIYTPIGIFVLAPGAFFVLAALTAAQNYIKDRSAAKTGKERKEESGCGAGCEACGGGCGGCEPKFYDDKKPAEKAETVKPEPVLEKAKPAEAETVKSEPVLESAKPAEAETAKPEPVLEETKKEEA